MIQHAHEPGTAVTGDTAPEIDLDLETVTDAITAGKPLADVLDLVVVRAAGLLRAREAFILLREGDELVGVAQCGLETPTPAAIRRHWGESIEGWVAARGRPLVLADPARDPRFQPLPQRQHPIASLIALPLQVDGRLWGVLSVATATRTDFADTLPLLWVLADLATLAITTTHERTRTLRRARLIDLLRYVTQAEYGRELRVTLSALADRIAAVLECEKVDVMQVDVARAALVSLGVSQTPLGRLEQERGLDLVPLSVPSVLRQVLHSGEATLVDDTWRDPRVYQPLAQELGIRAELISVIFVGQQPWGLLLCSSTRPRAFAPEDLTVLEVIARRLGLAIEQQTLSADQEQVETARLAQLEREQSLELLVHDVKNPLTSIKGYSQLGSRRLEQGDVAYARRAFEVIQAKSAQMEALLNDLTRVARLAAGTFRLTPQVLDLAELLANEVDAAQATTTQHTIRWSGPAPVPLWGDPLRLAEVVGNLLTNAVRYSPAGGQITADLQADPATARLQICDPGLGIAAADLPHIFERGYRGQGRQVAGGSGLGLYISREIVRLHGGRIWVEPAPTGGTCFNVELPCRQWAGDIEPGAAPAVPPSPPPG